MMMVRGMMMMIRDQDRREGGSPVAPLNHHSEDKQSKKTVIRDIDIGREGTNPPPCTGGIIGSYGD